MDKQAFTEMALAEMVAVYRLAVYLSSVHEADDLVQETYVRAFRSIATYKPTEYGMRPWLFKILHNDRLSQDQRRRATLEALRDEQGSTPAAASTAQGTGTHEVDWEQVDDRLKSAIDALPLHHKSIFLLSAIEGLRYREIAAIVDVPIGTVMSRLCRVRSALATQLSDVASERGLTQRRSPAPAALPRPDDSSAAEDPLKEGGPTPS